MKDSFLKNELIDHFLMEKLIEERICKKDCRMQGFVLEGYPKSKEQLDNLKNMKIDPTMIVAIDSPKELSQSRSQLSSASFEQRYQNWKQIEGVLRESSEKLLWVNPLLGISSMCEEVIH
jgi:adenylate kinase family enzyme